jgi:hypothetical protein
MSCSLYQFLYHFSHYVNHPISVNYTSIRLDRGKNHLSVAHRGTHKTLRPSGRSTGAAVHTAEQPANTSLWVCDFLSGNAGEEEDDKINYLLMIRTMSVFTCKHTERV